MDTSRTRRIPLLIFLAGLAALTLGGSVGTAAPQAAPAAVPGELLVGFHGNVSSADQRGVLAKAGAVEKRKFKRINGALVRVDPKDAEQALEKLRKDKRVRYAEPNFVYTIEATPNDPSYSSLWGLNNASDTDIDAPEAWDRTTGSNSVTVAVIDTGVDHAHPDLSAAIWTNPGENCAGCRTDGHDNDGNGYVDDWRGWDFVSDDNDPADDQGHGTHVAGTIGAVGNNGIGITGVNWQVRLMPVKFLNSAGSGTTADAISAVLYAADNGADVLNNSWAGDEYSQALGDAIAATDAQGALFVAAAGNDSNDNDTSPTYPASYERPNVLAVAATDSSDQPAWFSNYGRRSVDLGAPGVNIYSTRPGGSYQYLSGTSMAAPHVAGAAGLAKAAFPSATALGLKALLLDSADPVASLTTITASGARLNAASAVTCADAPKLWLDSPGFGSEAEVGAPLAIRAIATRCAESSGISISAIANGAPVALAARGDGFYSGTFTPTAAGPVTISVTATSGGGSRTRTATLNAAGVYPISPGGPSVTVTTTAAGENARLRFEGTAGQRVSLQLSAVTISTSYVSFRNADGSALAPGAYVFGSGGFVDTTTLPATGSYTILVDPQGTATGSMTATLYDVPADATGTIAPGGSATISNATPGQNARLTFSGEAGRRISLKLSGVTISTSSVSIYKPDGGALGSPAYVGTAGGFVDARTLPATGNYTILIDPQAASTGSMTATLYDVPADAGGAISPGGPAVTAAITTPGQNGRLGFDGTAGQRVSVKLSPGTISGSYVSIHKADGTSVGTSSYVGTSGGFVDTRALPDTGRYTILIDPQGAATGSMAATLYNVPADAAATISAGGPSVTIAATTPGQNARLTFDGQAGQRVSVKVGQTTISSSAVSIIKPDGKALGNITYAGNSGGFVDTRALPAAGSYTILIDPQGAATGSATVTLYDVPADLAGAITIGGGPTPVTISTPGQNARFTFDGQAGRRISLQLSSVTISLSYVTIWRPDGTRIGPNNMVTTAGRTITADLSTDGTYAIVIDPQAAATGSMTMTLT
jgi:subtilisin family serine protease